jgi:hypothetical protein
VEDQEVLPEAGVPVDLRKLLPLHLVVGHVGDDAGVLDGEVQPVVLVVGVEQGEGVVDSQIVVCIVVDSLRVGIGRAGSSSERRGVFVSVGCTPGVQDTGYGCCAQF